jgi:hypothetical protein
MDRAAYKTFKPGDRVTVRRIIKSEKWRPYFLAPGMVGVVESMDQIVRVRFPCDLPIAWCLYDGDLLAVSGDAPSGESVNSA